MPATSIWPGWPRSAWMRASNGPSLPRAASTVSAPITSADSSTGWKANSACSASAVLAWVPLISARPSLAANVSGADAVLRQHLARRAALAVDDELALAQQRQHHVAERCQVARGAHRALAGHAGHQIPALCTASRVSITTGRTPECPRARLAALVASISRTTGAAMGSPTPTLWLRIRLRCSVARSSALMRVPASLPKPVLTP